MTLETQERILKFLKELKHGAKRLGTIRSTICNQLNLPRSTVFDNLKILREQKKIIRYTRQLNNRGRPFTFWRAAR